jgi:VWFA-related protein
VLRFASSLALCALLAQQTQPTFTGGTDAVLLDVQVSRSGKPVPNLTAADFTVRDTDVVQHAELLSLDKLPVNLLLVLDTSASVRGPALEQLKAAAKGAVTALRTDDQAALLTFSHNVELHANWTNNRDDLTRAINRVVAQGSTSLADAAFTALAYRTKPGARTLILFFTDGDDTASWLSFHDLIPVARRSEAVVFGVMLTAPTHAGSAMTSLFGPGHASGQVQAEVEKWFTEEPSLYRAAMLPLLSIETGGESLQAADTGKLLPAFVDIVSRFSQRYVLSFTPSGVAPNGWHPIEVVVKGGGDVSVRRGYSR